MLHAANCLVTSQAGPPTAPYPMLEHRDSMRDSMRGMRSSCPGTMIPQQGALASAFGMGPKASVSGCEHEHDAAGQPCKVLAWWQGCGRGVPGQGLVKDPGSTRQRPSGDVCCQCVQVKADKPAPAQVPAYELVSCNCCSHGFLPPPLFPWQACIPQSLDRITLIGCSDAALSTS